MKNLLIKQLQFEYWACLELVKSMKIAQPLDDRALLLFSHILSSAKIWLNRIKGEPSTVTMFQERTLAECEVLMEENKVNWMNYLDKMDESEMHRMFEFIFPIDGSKKRISVIDGITHLMYHSAYHKGQIVTRLKGTVETLPFPQYVIYASEKVAE
jgi:uncharacterized damage-inducible protein DinB